MCGITGWVDYQRDLTAPAFLLDVNEWLRRYHVRLVLARRPDQRSGRDNVPLRRCPGVAARVG